MSRRWLILLALAVITLTVWHPARVAAEAVLLLPDVFPSAPIDPLNLVTPVPRETDSTLPYAAGTINVRIFHPSNAGRHAGVLLLLGAGELPREDLGVRFAQALARSGVVVMLPESTGLVNEQMSRAEIDGLVQSYDLLDSQSDVDPARTGIIGLSAAGGLAIVAAAQPALRDRVRVVTSLGGYYDASALVVDVASRSIDVDGQIRPWEPEQRTIDVIHNALGSDDLPAGVSREQAQAQVQSLPPAARQRLADISPSTYLSEVRAHLYLLHDTDDTFIPFTQTRALARAAPPGVVQRDTEFSIFAHVVPDRPVAWQTFLPDLWALYWDMHAVLLELL